MILTFLERHAGFTLMAFILLMCASCHPSGYPRATPVKSTWHVALAFDSTISPVTQRGLYDQLRFMVAKSQSTDVRFTEAADPGDADMIFYVRGYKPVTAGTQVAGVIVTALGTTLVPVALASSGASVIVAFWYTPMSRSVSTISIRNGENNSNVSRKSYRVLGPAFLRMQSKQQRIHARGYREHFRRVLKFYNRELKVARRKGLATTR